MLPDELKQLLSPEKFRLPRTRIRYNGIGPWLHGRPGRIWPRDSLNHQQEWRKISTALDDKREEEIILPIIKDRIREVVEHIFGALSRCNVNNLFNKCCPKGFDNFARVRFEINYALDAHTSYNQILHLIHSVIKSIDGINKHRGHQHASYVKTIFGSNSNLKIFEKNLKWFIIANAYVAGASVESFLSCGEKFMNLDEINWLDGLKPDTKCKVYLQVLFALLRFIMELLMRYFYITQSNPYFAKLFYFRYDLWQKIYHTATNRLIRSNLLKELRLDPGVLNSIGPFAISKLKYHLKKDDIRPICTKRKDVKTYALDKKFEAILRHILDRTANHRGFSLTQLLEGLRHFKERKDKKGDKIYIVRADIKDCFPSVNQNLLTTIIRNHVFHEAGEGGKVKLYKLHCKRSKDNKDVNQFCVDPEEFIRRHTYLTVINAIDESLSVDDFDQNYLRPCIIEPILRESRSSKNGYLLQQGLRQGSSFSPLLSSIYIQTAFNQELGEFLHSDSCRIYRYVDDILFISTDLKQSQQFMHKMLRGFKDYNLTMNLDKLACNFTCRGLDPRLCRLNDNLIFFRQRICLQTLKCRYHFSHACIQLQYSMRVHPRMDRNAIVKAVKSSRWQYIHLDETLNGTDAVIKNIFERASLLAHRAATLIIFSFFYCNNQDEELVVDLVKKTVQKAWTVIRKGRETNMINNDLSHQQVRLIVATAYEATWNLKKLGHRAQERLRLNAFRKRANHRHMFFKSRSNPNSPVPTIEELFRFESLIRRLMIEFPDSEFSREVLIPTKDARF